MIPQHIAEKLDLIAEYVRDHGRVALDIVDAEGGEADYTYSIGFPVSVAQPEVLVFALPQELRQHVIHALWHMMSEDGLVLEDGLRISGLLEGFDCIAREVTDREIINTYLTAGVDYHDSQHGKTVDRFFQVVWPDADGGLFPWDAGCADVVIYNQPALYSVSLNS
jgi:hypothetical protein